MHVLNFFLNGEDRLWRNRYGNVIIVRLDLGDVNVLNFFFVDVRC
jgi:hypothetical protein